MARPQSLRPRKSPRQDRARETQQRLLDAAAHVFAEHGYSAGTTNRIAAEAGMSIGSLYQYFPNKDAILVELTHAHLHVGSDVLEEHLATGLPEDLEALLRLAVGVMFDNHRGDHRLHQVLFEEAPRPPWLLEELRATEDAFVALLAAILEADATVQVPDRRLAARIVVTTIESQVHRAIAREPGEVDEGALTDELVRMLLGYLRGAGR